MEGVAVKQEYERATVARGSSSSSGSCGSGSSDDEFLDNLMPPQEASSKKRNFYEHGLVQGGALSCKKPKQDHLDIGFYVSPGFLAPLPLTAAPPAVEPGLFRTNNPLLLRAALPVAGTGVVGNNNQIAAEPPAKRGCKQFWKAGDYEEDIASDYRHCGVGIDHVRVHPKFLHSNATSHKWALGAFAELLDNALDEVDQGATHVRVDVLKNQKDGSKMLLVEDNGGGMTPDKMRQCMSLGYSAKSKMANTIGQYGNGFKTSTMRLGADVIVFSLCKGKDGNSQTQSIGLLSYTFLRATGKEDIVVPMIDFEKNGEVWKKKIRSSLNDWEMNLRIILQWSPFGTKEGLLQQFNTLQGQGTRVIIYNLWEDDEGLLELDFDVDPHDIQIRGVNRDRKKIEMAKQYPNSSHFFTYEHSLRSYASILYLRLPPRFRIFLRGKDVEHHNLLDDMMLVQDFSYKPLNLPEGLPKNTNMVATGKIGFVKDAHHHVDIQGFNVYHKNRLIKPFWRVWNAAGSDGRGVIGVLEANFIEPAHDKQGFERTTALSRVEAKLIAIQKNYWASKCHEIGYAARRHSRIPSSNGELSAGSNGNSLLCSRQKGQGFAAENRRTPPSNSNSLLCSHQKGQGFAAENRLTPPSNSNSLLCSHQKGQGFAAENRRTPPNNGKGQSFAAENRRTPPNNGKEQGFAAENRLTPPNNGKGPGFAAENRRTPPNNGKGQGFTAEIKRIPPADAINMNGNGHDVGGRECLSGSAGYKSSQMNINSRVLQPEAISQKGQVITKGNDCSTKSKTNYQETSLSNKDETNLSLQQNDLEYESEKSRKLQTQLEEERQKSEQLEKDNRFLLEMLEEKRAKNARKEEDLKQELQNATKIIEDLQQRLRQRQPDSMQLQSCKIEKDYSMQLQSCKIEKD